MNTADYKWIIYTGIAENSQHLSDYIKRECKKAQENFVEIHEFFDRLKEALEEIKNEFQNKYLKDLDNYYRWMNKEADAPTDQKYGYSNVKPDLNNIGLPLYFLTNMKYRGDLYIRHITQFEKEMNQIKSQMYFSNEKAMQDSTYVFDLKDYDLQTANSAPYFKSIKVKGIYKVYTGVFGKNIFKYFEILANSKAGKLLAEFDEKYIVKNSPRYSYADEWNTIYNAISGKEKLEGKDAYLKYWHDCHSDIDKRDMMSIFNIFHFDALKEYFNLNLEKNVKENSAKFLDEQLKEAHIKAWKLKHLESIKNYLLQGRNTNLQGFSSISSFYAGELIKYYRWIETGLELNSTNNKKNKQETIITFDELFYDAKYILPCIDILKKVDPPLIDEECNFIGKLKGAFCVWINEMERQGIIKHISDRKIFPLLLAQKIKRFSIDESMFGKPQPKAEDQYRSDMKTLISQVKLSQNSQKGKLGK